MVVYTSTISIVVTYFDQRFELTITRTIVIILFESSFLIMVLGETLFGF